MSLRALSVYVLATFATLGVAVPCAQAASLEADFQNPPVAARPYVWWHWMGSNFSESGITKDLEAMRAAGLGGATIFNLTSAVQESHAPMLDNPWPDQTYRSPKYWAALRHAAAEADRLGLEVGLHNTVGYSTTGGPWIDEERSMQRLVWSSVEVDGTAAPAALVLPKPTFTANEGWGRTGRKISFYRDVAVLAVPASDAPLARSAVLDLSARLKPGNTLDWTAPAGRWTVYRFGHASTGRAPHPIPDDVLGKSLEADKMSLEQTRFHWESVLNPLKEHLGPHLGKSFRHFLIDSYEAGGQTWTPAFRAEFQKRKGYDPLPWLVTLGAPITDSAKTPRARVLGSEDATARFEWDYRDVVSTLFYENGWKPAADMIRATGSTLQFEPYGGPFDTVAGTALSDLPMGEFWTNGDGRINGTIVAAARAAGRTVIGAEAFTGRPEVSQWTETPGFLKKSADDSFASGVNRMILHHWVHQPFDDRYQPGMGMGWWGTHFSRHQTWFEPGKAFFAYLGRVQALLQRGETPVNYVSVGSAAGGDVIPPAVFLAGLKVDDGQIVLPSGRRYHYIHLPHKGAVLPEILRETKRLLAAGATVVASRPDRSPSLANYPAADAEVKALATELWGNTNESVRKIGPGTLYTRGDCGEASSALKLEPFHRIASADAGDIRVHHRRDGDTDLFFVANMNNAPRSFVFSALVFGRQPELWNAETGATHDAPLWRAAAPRTEVNLSLGANRSVFVVFRRPVASGADPLVALEAPAAATLATDAKGRPVVSATSAVSGTARFASGRTRAFDLAPAAAVTLNNAWDVTLTPKLGAVSKLQLPALVSLSTLPEPAAKYFSGTATYRATVTIPAAQLGSGKRLQLDLGDVRDLVRVTVNGRDLGVLWQAPFVCDISNALRAGENTLELAVTNTWHNRLVGDEQEPVDFEFGTDRGVKMGRAMKRYPEWFLKNQPRPSSGRVGFVSWFYHRADTPLIPSGLLGPVRLVPVAETVLIP
jgi:hypothetical protein